MFQGELLPVTRLEPTRHNPHEWKLQSTSWQHESTPAGSPKHLPIPKGPCGCTRRIWALKGLIYPYWRTYLCTILVLGPVGYGIPKALIVPYFGLVRYALSSSTPRSLTNTPSAPYAFDPEPVIEQKQGPTAFNRLPSGP